MKKRRLVVGVVVLVLALTSLAILSGTRRGPRFADSVSFLKGIEPSHREQIFRISRPHLGATPAYKMDMDIFVFKEPFKSLTERTKSELKPRAYTASSYKGEFLVYGFQDSKTGLNVNMSFVRRSATETSVSINEYREASWIDEVVDWARNLVHPTPKQGPTIKLK